MELHLRLVQPYIDALEVGDDISLPLRSLTLAHVVADVDYLTHAEPGHLDVVVLSPLLLGPVEVLKQDMNPVV